MNLNFNCEFQRSVSFKIELLLIESISIINLIFRRFIVYTNLSIRLIVPFYDAYEFLPETQLRLLGLF